MSMKIVAMLAVVIVVAAGAGYLILNNGNGDDNGEEDTAIHITNTDGTITTIAQPAQRIVAMNVNTNEALIVLGAGSKVCGVSSATYNRGSTYTSHFSPTVVNVGSSTGPSLDQIVAANPDLIIGFSTMRISNQAQLEALGYPVAYLDCYIPGQLQRDILELGKAVGMTAEAESFVNYYNSKLTAVQNAVNSISASVRSAQRVYVEFSGTTYTNGYPAQCRGTSTDVTLSMLGVTNVAGSEQYNSYLSGEWLAACNAGWVFKILDLSNTTTVNTVSTELLARSSLSALPAKTNGNIYLVWQEISYGPRSFVGALMYAQLILNVLPSETISGWLTSYNTQFGTGFTTTYSFIDLMP